MENDGLVTASNEGDSWCRQQPLRTNGLIGCDLEKFSLLFSHRVGPLSAQCPYYRVIGHTLFESQQSADNQAADHHLEGQVWPQWIIWSFHLPGEFECFKWSLIESPPAVLCLYTNVESGGKAASTSPLLGSAHLLLLQPSRVARLQPNAEMLGYLDRLPAGSSASARRLLIGFICCPVSVEVGGGSGAAYPPSDVCWEYPDGMNVDVMEGCSRAMERRREERSAPTKMMAQG